MIRIDAVWLSTEPMDMRTGTDAALARVAQVFGASRPHHAHVFANRRSTRLKVLVHDGIGIWLAARGPLRLARWGLQRPAVPVARATRCARARLAVAAHGRSRCHHADLRQLTQSVRAPIAVANAPGTLGAMTDASPITAVEHAVLEAAGLGELGTRLLQRIERDRQEIDWRDAKLNGHDPYAYLRDVLARLPTQPARDIDELLPHCWAPPA